MRFLIKTKVLKIEELFDERYVKGVGKDVVFAKTSKGFFVLFEGSYEKLYLGMERPELQEGDRVRIIIENMER